MHAIPLRLSLAISLLFTLGATLGVATSAAALDSAFVAQEVKQRVSPGERFRVVLVYRNRGPETWTRASSIWLGTESPRDNQNWGRNRVGLSKNERITAGQTKRFSFWVTAPRTPGVYDFQWRMLKGGVAWFGPASGLVRIQVGQGGNGSGSGGGGSGDTGGSGGDTGGSSGGTPIAQGDFRKLTFVGYQGWFSTGRDGSFKRWNHWSRRGVPRPGHVTFELYPDVREYPAGALQNTQLGALGTGAPAQLFSSNHQAVVDVHFNWMRNHGIEGVALQRFVNALADPRAKQWRNQVTRKVKAAAERTGRSMYVVYDITGAPARRWDRLIKNDWTSGIEKNLRLPASPRYARAGNKPVVGLWGLGFRDRPGTQQQARSLIQWFKNRGVYVVGGVPYGWRDAIENSKPGWQDVYAQLDMIQPWSIGRYRTDEDLEHHFNNFILPDRDLAQSRGQDYQLVIYPGFSWSNWRGGARNFIPRRGGELLWRQAYFAREAGLSAMVAMFDEYDEATAIAKAAPTRAHTPQNQYFLTLDADGRALPSDHYLWLTGELTRMLRGDLAQDWDLPSR